MFSAKDLIFSKKTGGYQISRSLRFRSSASAYLSRTPAGAGTSTKTWTYSAWIKKGTLGGTVDLISARSAANPLFYFQIVSDQINIFARNSGGTTIANYTSASVFRDPSAWYHIVLKWDALTSTMGLYVNNVLQTLTTATAISNVDYAMNTAIVHEIGRSAYGASDYFDGYMAEIYMIDGQALTPSSFGETDATTGVWKPKAYTGTYGTNGFYLKFTDVGSTTAGGANTGYGKDFAGTNNWTTNNFGTTSTGSSAPSYDSMWDTPTPYDDGGNGVGNYCVLNPLASLGGGTISSANLNFAVPAVDDKACLSTIAVNNTTSKWYCEVTLLSPAGTSDYQVGLFSSSTASYSTTPMAAIFNTTIQVNGAQVATGTPSLASGDIVGVAYDGSAGAVSFYKNNALVGTYTISGANNRALYFGARSNGSGIITQYAFNFGQRPFTYTPPSGFKALNTQNLPTPTIAAGNKYMDISLWTGDGNNNRSITGLNFQPDTVWVKSRSMAYDALILDAVRTAGKSLTPSSTSAEVTNNANGYVSAFNSGGFTLTQGSSSIVSVNELNKTYVAWNWKANGAGTVDNVGTIQSTVSANTTAGFSVVTWTFSASNSTVGHGLGVAPSLIIAKDRASGAANWCVWHSALSASSGQYLNLNTTSATGTVSTIWGGVNPTSTTFGQGAGIGTGGDSCVAYCFAAVAGYSAFGGFTANGVSGDGNFIYLGFRPRFILYKRTDAASSWFIQDTARQNYNVQGPELYPESSAVENTATRLDILSNGFKIRVTGGSNPNVSGATYIYAAFAENPFSKALAF